MERKGCLIQFGPSYQFSPETMSGCPSRLISAMAQVSKAPGSIIRSANGISAGRVTAHAASARVKLHRNPGSVCSPQRLEQPILKTTLRNSSLVKLSSRIHFCVIPSAVLFVRRTSTYEHDGTGTWHRSERLYGRCCRC